jgi:gliding motility-associated protein GldL
MGLATITQSKGFKNMMAKLYGLGASIVIVGALFKIQHWEGAGLMLTIGLLTEAVIFFFSAFEPPHEEVDWSLVYPELAGMHEPGGDKHKKKKVADPVAQELDRLMAEAKIGPELIQSLGTGLRSLGENTSKLSDITNASVATDDYVKNVQTASKSVSGLASSYEKATQAMNSLSTSSDDVKVYSDQVSAAGKNLAALNAIYELQLQDSNKNMKETAKFFTGINELMSNLNATVEDTKRYKDEISKLSKNLSSLNTVYGNMLSAMNINAGGGK